MKIPTRLVLRSLASLLVAFCAGANAKIVAFELDRPAASQVFLAGEMTDWDQGKQPMVKSADGKWRLAVDLSPGQWVYKFVVDGQWIADPAGADNDSDGNGGRHSFLFTGDGPWRDDPKVPHGKVETTMLPSAAWGKPMKVNVYLPPGFRKSRSYPVLMLLHGAGMDADQWYRTGQIQRYMDNLIADRSIMPFVVVMPSSERVYYVNQSDTHIARELPPWLKSRYGQVLVAPRAAAAGMSMGGFGAVVLPMNHPGLFGLSYALSAYFPPEEVARMVIPNPLPFGLVMVTGNHDRVTESAPPFLAKLRQGGASYSYHEDAGAHAWSYWSHHIADMLRSASQHFSAAKIH